MAQKAMLESRRDRQPWLFLPISVKLKIRPDGYMRNAR